MDTIDYAETASIQEGFVVFSGRKLEPASAPARNQFGYELGYTWKEVAQIGAPIWVEKNGIVWCDPERHTDQTTGQPWKPGEAANQ